MFCVHVAANTCSSSDCCTFISAELDAEITNDAKWNEKDVVGYRFAPRAPLSVTQLRFRLPATNSVPTIEEVHVLLWDAERGRAPRLLGEVVLRVGDFVSAERTAVADTPNNEPIVLEEDHEYVNFLYVKAQKYRTAITRPNG